MKVANRFRQVFNQDYSPFNSSILFYYHGCSECHANKARWWNLVINISFVYLPAATIIDPLWLCDGAAVSEPAALCEGLHRFQLETGRGAGPAVLFGGPQLGVAGTRARSDSGLPDRTHKHWRGVASQRELFGGSGTQSQSGACWYGKLGRFWQGKRI